MNKLFILSLQLLLSFTILAQIPSGYYDAAVGKMNAELKTSLHLKIKNANVPSYGSGTGSTWAAFTKTDVRPEDGTVWDMYSNNHVPFNGNSAASGMNIEHSFAKSWWGDGRQAAQDIMHLAPSNSTANSAKGSWPMAVVDGTTSFSNGVIKVGKSSSRPGGVIDAWEPADEYKGDFSRAYMYMVTAYEDYVNYWTGNSVNQLDNNTYPVFEQWTVDLLLKWSKQDPVSQKEITRNNEVYKIQGNRNPYIDFPLMSEYVWGNLKTLPFTLDGNTTNPYLILPAINTTLNFGNVAYLQTDTASVYIKAANLTGDLSFALSGSNAAYFTLTTSSITKAQAEAGYKLIINYNAQNLGASTAQLIISGGGITSNSLTLNAVATDDFMALAATNTTSTAFTANWSISANATSYTLDVYGLVSSGSGQKVTLLEADFNSSTLPSGWVSENYTDLATSGALRLASGSNPGKITSPAINLTQGGKQLVVSARQYSNDTGAPLTATLNNLPLAVWNTTATNQNYTVDLPISTANALISLSAASGRRVYVDNFKVETQGITQTKVSVNGYPLNVGNTLSYQVSGLATDSTYYYTVSPQGNSAAVSNSIQVHTLFNSGIDQTANKPLHYILTSDGLILIDLPTASTLSVYNIVGKQLLVKQINNAQTELKLDKGIYVLQLQNNQKNISFKVIL